MQSGVSTYSQISMFSEYLPTLTKTMHLGQVSMMTRLQNER